MKCANETVTIELKNGTDFSGPVVFVDFTRPSKLLTLFYRHYTPWHYHLRLPSNEHRSPRRQNDTQGARSDSSGHDQYPWLYYQIFHPAGFTAVRHSVDR